MFRASKFCTRCRKRFPLAVITCTTCRSTNAEGHLAADRLWTVELLANGSWKYWPPESLGPLAMKKLARTSGAPDNAA